MPGSPGAARLETPELLGEIRSYTPQEGTSSQDPTD